MKKYAIVNAKTKEFYADPVYTDLEKANKKIEYLAGYRLKHNMPSATYEVEELTADRETQHNEEWQKFCAMLD